MQASATVSAILNRLPRRPLRYAAEDWTPSQGPRGGHVWTNVKSGEKVYQQDNPGGASGGKKPAESPPKSSGGFTGIVSGILRKLSGDNPQAAVPLTAFHGTRNDFSSFDPSRLGSATAADIMSHLGFNFTME